MFKFVLKWSSVATKPPASKFYSSTVPQHEQIARQMINYAVGHARSKKSGESYAQAMLILEQGLSNAKENTKGMFMLAMSTLLYERGEVEDAFKELHVVYQLKRTTPTIKAATSESLLGLNLEAGEDVASSAPVLVEDCFQLLSEGNEPFLDVAKVRLKAVKDLSILSLEIINQLNNYLMEVQTAVLKIIKINWVIMLILTLWTKCMWKFIGGKRYIC